MSMLVRNEFVVGCTQEEAFDFLSDLRNELEWNPGHCQSVEKVTDGPIGRGTMYRAKWKGSPQIEVEYVHFDRPHTWRAHSDGLMETNFQCTVERHADGAKLVTELELIPHGFFRLVFPIFKLLFSKAEKASAGKIRKTLNERYGDWTEPPDDASALVVPGSAAGPRAATPRAATVHVTTGIETTDSTRPTQRPHDSRLTTCRSRRG